MFPYELLQEHSLFTGLTLDEIKTIFNCFHFSYKQYQKNEYIFLEGDSIQFVGTVIHGTVLIEKSDSNGNNYFLTSIADHGILGSAFMGDSTLSSTVNYKAASSCHILFFSYTTLFAPCHNHCTCHQKFCENYLQLVAKNTRTLMYKLEILSHKLLRDKLLTFLRLIHSNSDLLPMPSTSLHTFHHKELEADEFVVPFNHSEIAEFLSVNRSALERELSKMKKEGILTYHKNTFRILENL